MLSGDDALNLPLCAIGGDGVISVVSNLAPAEVTALTKAALDGDFERPASCSTAPVGVPRFVRRYQSGTHQGRDGHEGSSGGTTGCRWRRSQKTWKKPCGRRLSKQVCCKFPVGDIVLPGMQPGKPYISLENIP